MIHFTSVCVQAAKHIHARFEQIEGVLGFDLPVTARKRPQWWANEQGKSTHVQSQAWLDAGFETRNLDLAAETVDFDPA